MNHNNIIDDFDESRQYTKAELRQIFRRWQQEEILKPEKRELPNEIVEILEGSPLLQLEQNLQKFKKQVRKYHHEEWTRGEKPNKECTSIYKKHKVDTYQVLNTIYNNSESTRLQARAATELFEKAQYLEDNRAAMNQDRVFELVKEINSYTKQLAVLSWFTAKQQDQEARSYSLCALGLPSDPKRSK